MQYIIPPLNIHASKRLAVITDQLTQHDYDEKSIFVGPQGNTFYGRLQQHDLWRSNTLRAISHPPGDAATHLADLRRELEAFDPNCLLLLGPKTLELAGITHSLDDFRGTVFLCNDVHSPFNGYKCVATFNAERIFKDFSEARPLAMFDTNRAAIDSTTKDLNLPLRNYDIHLGPDACIAKMREILPGQAIALDIEGGIPPAYAGVSCISIATSSTYAFILRLADWTPIDQARVMLVFNQLMRDTSIKKVLQNSLYDNFVLSWLWKTPILNVVHDTMLSGWEIFPELPKALGTQASIWTRQPHYKFERKIDDPEIHYRYCCTDSCVTLEIAEKHTQYLSSRPAARRHFEHNMQLLPPTLHMELRGIKYLQDEAKSMFNALLIEQAASQEKLDKLLGQPINPNSPKQMTHALYKIRGYPPQYKIVNGRKTSSLTADTTTLLNFYRGDSDPFIHEILMWKQLDSARKQLAISCDTDGRMRSQFNVVGTVTGRYSSEKSPTGQGFNLQTIMKKMRKLYVPDDGYIMAQIDLEGADGWTVAAHCKSLGDSTMMDDYLAKIKPARVIAALYLARQQRTLDAVSRLDREALKAHIKSIEIPEWLYNAAKAVQHGSNYLMQGRTMSTNILRRGWKDANIIQYVSPMDCDILQKLYFDRYWGVPKWHDAVQNILFADGIIRDASGHERKFNGRSADKNVHREACSHEPQANTTYANNLALWRLWHDEENWDKNKPIIEPLLQVHDAWVLQFPESKLDWALGKIRNEYWNTELTISNQKVTIPFDGGYGTSWYDTKTPI